MNGDPIRCKVQYLHQKLHTASDARCRRFAIEPGGRNEALHPYIVIDFSFFLRLRGCKGVAHGSSRRLDDNFLHAIVKDVTAIIPTR